MAPGRDSRRGRTGVGKFEEGRQVNLDLRKFTKDCPVGVKALVCEAVLEIESGSVAPELVDLFTQKLTQGAYWLRAPDSVATSVLSRVLGRDVQVTEQSGLAGMAGTQIESPVSEWKSWLLYGGIFAGMCWLVWKLKPKSKQELHNPLYKKRWKISPRHDRVLVVS